jgi:hypothetical protein
VPGHTGASRICSRASPYSLLCVDSTPEPGEVQPARPAQPVRADAAGAGSAYAVLFLLGVMEGLIGCFQYSHVIGPVPVAGSSPRSC